MSGSADKNFGLTSEQFVELRRQLTSGDDDLFVRIFLSQFSETKHYLEREDGATSDNAYDATMDALLLLRRGLITESIGYGNLRFLFTRMARQQLQRNSKKYAREVSDPGIDLPELGEVTIDAETYRLLARGWKSLKGGCRKLLLATFYSGLTAEHIAVTTSTLPATVRKQKQRCIEKLREAVRDSPLRALR